MSNNQYGGNAYESEEERLEKEQLRRQKTALVDRFLVLNQNDLPDDKIPMLRENMLHCSLAGQALTGCCWESWASGFSSSSPAAAVVC